MKTVHLFVQLRGKDPALLPHTGTCAVNLYVSHRQNCISSAALSLYLARQVDNLLQPPPTATPQPPIMWDDERFCHQLTTYTAISLNESASLFNVES